jgi:hypothetical protein
MTIVPSVMKRYQVISTVIVFEFGERVHTEANVFLHCLLIFILLH